MHIHYKGPRTTAPELRKKATSAPGIKKATSAHQIAPAAHQYAHPPHKKGPRTTAPGIKKATECPTNADSVRALN
jgi:hypothetical protein